MTTTPPTWPPTLADLKEELKIEPGDTRDDVRHTTDLNAAIDYIERVRPVFRYDQTNPDQLELPDPTHDHWLGTIRLAVRWNDRRRSKDGMVAMGELGTTRVASYDNDIDRMLGIGRHKPMSESFA